MEHGWVDKGDGNAGDCTGDRQESVNLAVNDNRQNDCEEAQDGAVEIFAHLAFSAFRPSLIKVALNHIVRRIDHKWVTREQIEHEKNFYDPGHGSVRHHASDKWIIQKCLIFRVGEDAELSKDDVHHCDACTHKNNKFKVVFLVLRDVINRQNYTNALKRVNSEADSVWPGLLVDPFKVITSLPSSGACY